VETSAAIYWTLVQRMAAPGAGCLMPSRADSGSSWRAGECSAPEVVARSFERSDLVSPSCSDHIGKVGMSLREAALGLAASAGQSDEERCKTDGGVWKQNACEHSSR
jgi:hypothetical protein